MVDGTHEHLGMTTNKSAEKVMYETALKIASVSEDLLRLKP